MLLPPCATHWSQLAEPPEQQDTVDVAVAITWMPKRELPKIRGPFCESLQKRSLHLGTHFGVPWLF